MSRPELSGASLPGKPLAQITSSLPKPNRDAKSIFKALPGQVGNSIVGTVLKITR